jgi:hypothetical protein
MLLAREVGAKNFVLYIGHLGRRESVVQPAAKDHKRSGGRFFVFGESESEKGKGVMLRG